MAEENNNTLSRPINDDEEVNSQVSVSDDATELDIRIHQARYEISLENARKAEETAKSRMDEASERRDPKAYSKWKDEVNWEQHLQDVFQRKIEATKLLLNPGQERSVATAGDTTHRSNDNEEGAAPESSTAVTATGERQGADTVNDMMPESLAGDETHGGSMSTTEPQVQASPSTQRSEELATSAHQSRQESAPADST